MRSSCGKYDTAYVDSVVELVTGANSPPVTATEYTFQMPVLFEDNRIRDSSEENDASRIDTVSRNCSIVYCFGERGWGEGRTAWAETASATSISANGKKAIRSRARIAVIPSPPFCGEAGILRQIAIGDKEKISTPVSPEDP